MHYHALAQVLLIERDNFKIKKKKKKNPWPCVKDIGHNFYLMHQCNEHKLNPLTYREWKNWISNNGKVWLDINLIFWHIMSEKIEFLTMEI